MLNRLLLAITTLFLLSAVARGQDSTLCESEALSELDEFLKNNIENIDTVSVSNDFIGRTYIKTDTVWRKPNVTLFYVDTTGYNDGWEWAMMIGEHSYWEKVKIPILDTVIVGEFYIKDLENKGKWQIR